MSLPSSVIVDRGNTKNFQSHNFIVVNLFWVSTRWALIPFLVGLLFASIYPDFRWESELFHTVLESSGALIGFGLAYIIYTMIVKAQLPNNFVWLIACFISMGILDIFHSLHHTGHLFVWFHSLATCIGGLFSCLIWRSDESSKKYLSLFSIMFITVFSISIGVISSYWPDRFSIPMLDLNGQFTIYAKLLNFSGGTGFLITWFYFAHKLHQYKSSHSSYFSNHFFLFGLAGFIFELSAIWDGNWWLWHILRGFAYLLLLSHFIVIFQKEIAQKIRDSQQNLLAMENRFHSIVDTSPDWIWEVDLNYKYTYASPKVYDILGYKPEEIIGKTPFDSMRLEEIDRFKSTFCTILEKQKPFYALENINRHSDGHEVVLETSGTPIFSNQGKLTGYHGVNRDITERKNAENLIRSSEEKYRLAMEATHDGLWDWNIESSYVYYSPAWKRIIGTDNIGNNYKAWEQRIYGDDREKVLASLESHLSGDTDAWKQEYRLKKNHDGWTWVLSRGKVVKRDGQGNPMRMIGTMTDISK